MFESPNGTLQIIEVKSVGDFAILESRVSRRQRGRLGRVAEYFLQYHPEVELLLAFVDGRNKVQIFDEL